MPAKCSRSEFAIQLMQSIVSRELAQPLIEACMAALDAYVVREDMADDTQCSMEEWQGKIETMLAEVQARRGGGEKKGGICGTL